MPALRTGARSATALTAALTAALGACLLTVVVGAPATAAWSASSTRTSTVTMAAFSTTLTKAGGEGALSNGSYTLNGLVTPQTGYLRVTNSSSASALVRLDYRMSSLVADTAITACPRPWGADGSCAGATTLADSRLLGSPTGTYSWPSPVAPGAEMHLRVSTTGVTGGVTLSTTAVTARTGPADRTLG